MSEVGGGDTYYNPPPPPPAAAMKKKRSPRKGKGVMSVEGGGGGGGGKRAKTEKHIINERERRKKMNDNFSILHDLLPHIPAKSNRTSILGEATTYIKKLKLILEDGERQKLERSQNGVVQDGEVEISTEESNIWNNNNNNIKDDHNTAAADFGTPVFETWSWPNVVLNVCGEHGQFSVCTLNKPNNINLTSICSLFENYKLDVVYCNIISNQTSHMYMFTTHMRKGSTTYDAELPAPPEPTVEIFKRAAAEMSYCISSQI